MKRLIIANFSSIRWFYCNRLSSFALFCILAMTLQACGVSSLVEPNEPQHVTSEKNKTQGLASAKNGRSISNIAVLLPETGAFATAGNAIKRGFLYAKSQDQQGSAVNVRTYNTAANGSIGTIYENAVKDGADMIIGPLRKEDVETLFRSSTISKPTLALNYTSGSLPAKAYEIGLLPEDEVAQLTREARKLGLRRALIIAPRSAQGDRLSKPLAALWSQNGGSIVGTLYFTPKTDFSKEVAALLQINTAHDKKLMRDKSNKNTLEAQRRHDFDVIFLLTRAKEARAIVPLLRYYYVSDTPIFATSAVYAEPDPVNDVDINGVRVCDMPASMQVDHAPKEAQHRLYALGQDAYLITRSLHQLETVGGLTLPGETGELSMTSRRQIHRSISCGIMRNGYLSPTR